MKLDVAALKDQPGRREQVPLTVWLDAADVGGDVIAFPVPFAGMVDMVSTGEGILIHFRLDGEVELQCARCLQPFRRSLTLDFTEEFRPGETRGIAGDLEEDPEQGVTFVYYQGDSIDVTELLRQHILLGLPMKPLCAEVCQGLCPVCGHNRNEGDCGCRQEEGDPRLQILEELRRRLKPES